MAINIDKMKARKQALENRGGKSSSFWRPQDGDQTIRIVPQQMAIPSRITGFITMWATILDSSLRRRTSAKKIR